LSAIHGDKARSNRQRLKKISLRKRSRELRKTLGKQNDAPAAKTGSPAETQP
jgi:hypothetical protein